MEFKKTKPVTKSEKLKKQERLMCLKVKEARGSGWISFNDLKLLSLPVELLLPLRNLQNLFMSNCSLKGELPLDLGKLKRLQVLDASCNLLVSIPDNLLSNLQSLTVLDLSRNHITSVPYTVGDLHCCKELCLAHNDLVALPHTIAYMNHLQLLDVGHNRIAKMATDMFAGGLRGTLQVLRINNNQLDRLPRDVGRLSALEELDVSNNCIYFLPSTIDGLERLNVLKFHGNNWTNEIPRFKSMLDDGVKGRYGVKARKTARALVHPDA